MARNNLICSTTSVSDNIDVFSVDLISAESTKPLKINIKAKSIELEAVKVNNENSYFISHSSHNTQIFQIESNKINQILSIDRATATSFTNNRNSFLFTAYYDSTNLAKIYDLKNLNLISTLKFDNSKTSPVLFDAPLTNIRVLASDSGNTENDISTTTYQIFATRKDCRVDFYEAVSTEKVNDLVLLTLDWVRFEGLAEISIVEMLDLPLSESQARIENEFGAENGL